jgi:predicted O-methyltransferase YrrM
MFAHVLPPLLASVDGPVDLAFDDGDHQPASTLANFQLLFPRLRSGGVLVIDDINHLTGVAEVWQAIVQESELAASVEINGRVGVCIKR